jgi:hypothetical protein
LKKYDALQHQIFPRIYEREEIEGLLKKIPNLVPGGSTWQDRVQEEYRKLQRRNSDYAPSSGNGTQVNHAHYSAAHEGARVAVSSLGEQASSTADQIQELSRAISELMTTMRGNQSAPSATHDPQSELA